MSYRGSVVPIPVGQAGLLTDEPMSEIPNNAAITANNVTLYRSKVEKSPGSALYNPVALPSPIVALYDWFPTPSAQTLIAVTQAGNIYRDSGDKSFTNNTPFLFTEVQKVSVIGVAYTTTNQPYNGNFQLTVGGTSLTVPASATATSLQTQIRAIAGYSQATVSGDFKIGFTITMTGVASPVASTTTTTATSTDNTVSITYPATTTLFDYSTVYLRFSGVPNAGQFSFTYAGQSSGQVVYNASAAQLQAVLQQLVGLPAATVTGTYQTGYTIVINTPPGLTTSQLGVTNVGLSNAGGTVTPTIYNNPIGIKVQRISVGRSNLGTLTPDTMMVQGGAEAPNNNRKLFVYTGGAQVQVINGSANASADIQQPAADWTSSYPTGGIIFQGRMVAFGVAGNPHTLYLSSLTDHENFLTPKTAGTITASDPQFFPVFPGEGDAIVGATVYKGALIVFKKPYGVYAFYWPDTTQAPQIIKYSDSIGIASAHGAVTVLDDLIGISNAGSLFSLKSVQNYGNFETGDILNNTKTRDYYRQNLDPSGYVTAQAVYYPEKQVAYFTGKSTSSSPQDRIIVMDVARDTPRMSLETKDQPTCIALRRDSNRVMRPMYGSQDGFVYLMDQSGNAVGSRPYTGEFVTPSIDFSKIDATVGNKNKIYDFLEVQYESSGNWSFYVDVFVDSVFKQTLTFTQKQGAVLDTFVLDRDRLGNSQLNNLRQRLSCSGKSISFRIYNNQLNQNFKVSKLVVSFRLSGEQTR